MDSHTFDEAIDKLTEAVHMDQLKKIWEQIYKDRKESEFPANMSSSDVVKTAEKYFIGELIDLAFETFKVDAEKAINDARKHNVPSPDSVFSKLSTKVISHDGIKKKLIMAFNDFLLYERLQTVLLIGESGSGKTFMVRELCRIYDLDLLEYDASRYTISGYHGDDICNIVSDISKAASKNKVCVFIDEVDKKAGTERSVTGSGVQSELLKLMEPSTFRSGGVRFDNRNVLFIFAGAFSDLFDSERQKIGFSQKASSDISDIDSKLYHAGITREFLGRINTLCLMEPLDYYALGKVFDIFLSEYRKFYKENYNTKIIIKNKDKVSDIVIRSAIRSKTNARGIKRVMSDVFSSVEYDVATQKTLCLVLKAKDDGNIECQLV